jgi:hypothetical protein
MAEIADERPDEVFPVSADYILVVENLLNAAALVVQSDGSYDLENLSDSIMELEDA